MQREVQKALDLHGSDHPVSGPSAGIAVPLILGITGAASVVDVGCGAGNWIVAFQNAGVRDYFGVDGVHIPPETLRFPAARFLAHDLTTPLRLDRRFDLAISLEVAEHLPESAAAVFVKSLTDAADIVVFSAAIPLQSGPGHVNEQWPPYWARLFSALGYNAVDCLRPTLWSNEGVESYYAQNMLLFANQAGLARLRTDARPGLPNALVHPKLWLAVHSTPKVPSAATLPRYIAFHATQVARSLARAVKRRMHR